VAAAVAAVAAAAAATALLGPALVLAGGRWLCGEIILTVAAAASGS
jgi:hypothetical protein